MPTFKLRPYQSENGATIAGMLKKKKIVAFVGEVRTGKTLTALHSAELLRCRKVLFLTKKKAMSGILKDYKSLDPNFELIVINYQSQHKVDRTNLDMVICDESHGFSSFPKPSKWAKEVKLILQENPDAYTVLLSGTFSPESYSQVYHQFWISPYSPFIAWKSFYKWAHEFVDIKKKRVGNFEVNDYSRADEGKIDEFLKGYMLSFTQTQAGFKSSVRETIHYVPQHLPTLKIIKQLREDKIVEGVNDTIIADSGAKMQQKCHQLYSGTIKLDSGKRIVLNTVKADYIKSAFKSQRLAIIYKFVAELEAIKSALGDSVTTDLEEFQASDHLHFAGQVAATKEGTNLSLADVLVMYNIDFSATAYFQARARLSTQDRPETDVHWIFSKGGLEDDIYKAVAQKKDYTLSYFKKYLTKCKKGLSL